MASEPIPETEIWAAAMAMVNCMFAPHELPLQSDLWERYLKTAEAALNAAARVRKSHQSLKATKG